MIGSIYGVAICYKPPDDSPAMRGWNRQLWREHETLTPDELVEMIFDMALERLKQLTIETQPAAERSVDTTNDQLPTRYKSLFWERKNIPQHVIDRFNAGKCSVCSRSQFSSTTNISCAQCERCERFICFKCTEFCGGYHRSPSDFHSTFLFIPEKELLERSFHNLRLNLHACPFCNDSGARSKFPERTV